MTRCLSVVCIGLWLACWQLPPSAAFAQTKATAKKSVPRVLIETELGNIEAEIDTVRAPLTAANFLRYVDAGHYNGGQFHRTVKVNPDNQPNNQIKIEVIQASVNSEQAKAGFSAIPLERTSITGLKHKDGALSMARDAPDTATSDFFICIGAQPELDFGGKRNPDGQGFAAFGRVIRGRDVVKKIQQAPAAGQQLKPAIKIISIKRLEREGRAP